MNSTQSLSQLLFDPEQVRQHEGSAAKAMGVDLYTLMQRAGDAAFSHLKNMLQSDHRVLVCVGSGNNGGDALVVATLAIQEGLNLTAASLGASAPKSADAVKAYEAFSQQGGTLTALEHCDPADFDLIVDGLLGTGVSGDICGPLAEQIDRINAANKTVLCLDVPSGLDAATGAVLGRAIQANDTVCFVAYKTGLFTGAGRGLRGTIHLEPLGIAQALIELARPRARRIIPDNRPPLPRRLPTAHKGDHGRVLCIGGDEGMSGAIRLAAEGALRAGAGLVRVLTHSAHKHSLNQGRPELMLSDENDIKVALAWASVVILGPGLGRSDWGKSLYGAVLQHCLANETLLILDADALYFLSLQPRHLAGHCIITPHAGEAARLIRRTAQVVNNNRIDTALALKHRLHAQTLLKGPGSVLVTDRGLELIDAGNPGMASGGMGDLLSGIIGGLCAQGLSAPDALCLAAIVHSSAADKVGATQGERGMLASDLLTPIRKELNQ